VARGRVAPSHGGAARLGGQHGRRGGFAPVSRSRDMRGAVQAGDASERGPRRKGKGKGARRLGPSVAERSERRAE
jgi:hypothetical protein